jgi:hypothetical protein
MERSGFLSLRVIRLSQSEGNVVEPDAFVQVIQDGFEHQLSEGEGVPAFMLPVPIESAMKPAGRIATGSWYGLIDDL